MVAGGTRQKSKADAKRQRKDKLQKVTEGYVGWSIRPQVLLCILHVTKSRRA